MAEVKTVVRHRLTTGTPIEEAMAHADRVLARRRAYASVMIIQIDKTTGVLHYLNAGTFPCSTGVTRLDGGNATARSTVPGLGSTVTG